MCLSINTGAGNEIFKSVNEDKFAFKDNSALDNWCGHETAVLEEWSWELEGIGQWLHWATLWKSTNTADAVQQQRTAEKAKAAVTPNTINGLKILRMLYIFPH